MSSGGSWASWLFAKCIERLKDKSIQREGGEFEPGISGLQIKRPYTKQRRIQKIYDRDLLLEKTNLPFLIKQELNPKLIHL